jgi:hypothetical protein
MSERILKHRVPVGETPAVLLRFTVRGDLIFSGTCAHPGEHKAYMNRYGAVSVMATNGRLLGLRPGEFEWVSGKPAQWGEGGKHSTYVLDPYEGDWTHEAGAALAKKREGKP